MNIEIQKLWTNALRSGKYKQGKVNLRRNDEFCCLGVLCELAVQNNIIAAARPIDFSPIFTYDDYAGSLPPSVIEWAEIQQCYAQPQVSEGFLYDLNDNEDWSFNQLADIIEREL